MAVVTFKMLFMLSMCMSLDHNQEGMGSKTRCQRCVCRVGDWSLNLSLLLPGLAWAGPALRVSQSLGSAGHRE